MVSLRHLGRGFRGTAEAGKAIRAKLKGFVNLIKGSSRILIPGGTGSDLSFRKTSLATVWRMEWRVRRQEVRGSAIIISK